MAPSITIALILLPAVLAAQGDGSIRGTVTSADHHAVTGARVAVESPARVAAADANGRFTLRDLTAGRHEVLVTAIGYKPLRRSVDVVAGQTATLDAQL